jgi:hypothetical protein
MSLQHLAKHVAAKGRNGDTTLVHMTKGEVAGLQALAKQQGTSLTINPHTGLPEAFSLKSLIPMAAGFALAGPAGLTAMEAALAVGGVGAVASGSLKEGLMAGLGAYGGAGLAGMAGLTAGTGPVAGAGLGTGAGATSAAAAPVATPTALTGTELGSITGAPAGAGAEAAAAQFAPSAPAYTGMPEVSAMTPQAGYVAPQPPPASPINGLTETNMQAVGPSTSYVSPPAVNTGTATGADMDIATSGTYGGPVKPTAFETFMKNAAADPMAAAKTGAYALSPAIADELKPKKAPEIKRDTDMGQRYIYDSGYDNSLPGRTGQPSYTKVSSEEAKKYYGFADGGEVQYPYDEPVVRMAAGGSSVASSTAAPSSGYGAYTPADAQVAAYGLGTGINYSGYDTAPNQGIIAALPKSNPNQNIVDLYKKVDEDKKAAAAKKAAEEAAAASAYTEQSFAAQGGLMQSYAQGGISSLGSYSDGGRLLKGPGDGVSDSIPAVIGRKQPARLADGEFVVPARIVSEIGNGSTEAGARKLYAMMDRVQSARGKTVAKGKVAKNTRADKFLPA